MNEDLNTAFVKTELDKTLSPTEELTNWNLLNDPSILHEETPSKHSHSHSSHFMLSSIRLQEKIEGSHSNKGMFEEDEELKELFHEMTKGKAKK